MSDGVVLRVSFANGTVMDYPVTGRGSWRWTDPGDALARLIVRPTGGMSQNEGRWQARCELPAMNVLSVEVLAARGAR